MVTCAPAWGKQCLGPVSTPTRTPACTCASYTRCAPMHAACTPARHCSSPLPGPPMLAGVLHNIWWHSDSHTGGKTYSTHEGTVSAGKMPPGQTQQLLLLPRAPSVAHLAGTVTAAAAVAVMTCRKSLLIAGAPYSFKFLLPSPRARAGYYAWPPSAHLPDLPLPPQAAQTVRHLQMPCSYHQRSQVVRDLVTSYGCGGRTIVFTDTKKDANELSQTLGER